MERDYQELTAFLEEYFGRDDVPRDEDKLRAYITDKFTGQRKHYGELIKSYGRYIEYDRKTNTPEGMLNIYPDYERLKEEASLPERILNEGRTGDIITAVFMLKDSLFIAKKHLDEVENFLRGEAAFSNKAERLEHETLWPDMDCYRLDGEAGGLFRALSDLIVLREFKIRSTDRLKEILKAIEVRSEKLRIGKYGETMKLLEECRKEIHARVKTPEERCNASAADAYYLDMKMLLRELLRERALLTRMDGAAYRIRDFRDMTIARMKRLRKPESSGDIIAGADKFIASYLGATAPCRKVADAELPGYIRKVLREDLAEYGSIRYPKGKPYAGLLEWTVKTMEKLVNTEDDQKMMALLPALWDILKRAGERSMIFGALTETEAFLEQYEISILPAEKERMGWTRKLWKHIWEEQEYCYLDSRFRALFRLLLQHVRRYRKEDEYRCFSGIENMLLEIDDLLKVRTEEKGSELHRIWEKCTDEIKEAAKGHLSDEAISRISGSDYGDGEMPLRVMKTAADYESPALLDGLLMRILRYKDQLIEKMQTEIKEKKE